MKTLVLDKMRKVQHDSQAIGEFLGWLPQHGFCVCEIEIRKYNTDDAYYPAHLSTEALLAKYFGINLARAEQERRAILNDLRRRVQ